VTTVPRTLADELGATAARDPERIAIVDRDRRLTYGELHAMACGVASGLSLRGVQRGDRVVLMLPNGAEFAVAFYGTLLAGAAAVPVNPTTKEHKLDTIVDHSGASEVLGDPSEVAVMARGDGPVPAAPLDLDLAAIIYTSGTTGTPKGVTLAHRNMTFVADSMVEYLEMTADERVLCVLPLSFGYGLYQLITCVQLGATLVIERGIAFPGRIVELLERERITAMPGVPTIWRVLTELQGLAERELPHLRTVTNAGARLPEPAIAAVRRTFPGARLFSMYGQTECQRICYLPPEELGRRPSSVGVAIPGTEVWIEHEDGSIAAPGEVGQLVVRGAHVMQGYWDDPAATAKRLRPGRWPWERDLLTGDLFCTDEDGFLHFVGRTDDIIKSRGEKVAPREIEDVLHSADGVAEVAVVGVEDPLLGQAIHAHVSPAPGAELDPVVLRRLCAEHLEDFMVPGEVIVHDTLPKTANGKIDRRSLV
jgi:acyl-CoA synthetase (AMP-forming)/AMP-acid ligase II